MVKHKSEKNEERELHPVALPEFPAAPAVSAEKEAELAPPKPSFEVVLRANEMDLETINGQPVYFVGAHPILRTPLDWAEKLGEEPQWFEFKIKNGKPASLVPTTFKDAKGQIHPAYFVKTLKEIALWMHRQ